MTAQQALPWYLEDGRICVRIRVTPNARNSQIDGLVDTVDGPAFRVRLNAPAQEGKANAALMGLAAKWFTVAKHDVTLKSGLKSRLKLLVIVGDVQPLETCARATLNQLKQQN